MKNVFAGIILTVLLTGCGVPKLPDDAVQPQIPILQSITYSQGGADVAITDLISYFFYISPDYGGGSCTDNQAEVVFKGTVDAVSTTTLEVIGADSPTITVSNGQFEVVACAALGSTSFHIKGLNANGDKSVGAVNFSLSLSTSTSIMTLGFGHPRYPAPGFMVSGTSKKNLVTTGDVELNTIEIGTTMAKEIQATGNTNLTMRVGFVSAVRENHIPLEN